MSNLWSAITSDKVNRDNKNKGEMFGYKQRARLSIIFRRFEKNLSSIISRFEKKSLTRVQLINYEN